MKGNDLRTKQVLASRQFGESNGVLAGISDEGVNGPCVGGGVVSVRVQLDPDVPRAVRRGWGNVDLDGSLVRASNDIVARIAAVVVPFEGDLVTAGNLDGLAGGHVVDVAGHIRRGDILDRIIVWRRANVARSGVSEALVHIIDPDGVDGGVRVGCASGSGQRQNGGSKLHLGEDSGNE